MPALYMACEMLGLIWFILFFSDSLQKTTEQMDVFKVRFGENDDKEKWLTSSHVAMSENITAYQGKPLV